MTALEKAKKPLAPWIETVLSEASSEGDREVFRVGSVAKVGGQSHEAERFAFVNRLDGLIGIGGRRGTEQALVLALATERPILPIPLFKIDTSDYGALRVWNEHEDDLRTRLGLDDEAVARWTKSPTAVRAAETLASEMVDRLLSSMQRRCFVIMPFQDTHNALYDFVIEPAVSSLGDQPIRIDRAAIPGNVGTQIEDGIDNSDYVIVVLDGMRPNVMYELGMAHGRLKPTILLNRRGDVGDLAAIPFDLTMHQRLEYGEVDGQLPQRLQQTIRALPRTL